MYTDENISELITKTLNAKLPDHMEFYFHKIKKDIEVHSKGHLFDKITKLYSNEDPEITEHVVLAGEPITKGSFWRGVNNLTAIFSNTSFKLTANENILQTLEDANFYRDYSNKWVDKSIASDPNSVSLWKLIEGKWILDVVQSNLIKSMDKDSITFIDLENSDYTISLKSLKIDSKDLLYKYKNNKGESVESYYRKEVYNFKTESYIHISKTQYITFRRKKEKNEYEYSIFDFQKELTVQPYAPTGIVKIMEGVYNSPLEPFIPFANIALLQHRAFTNIEKLFGYPRMSEIELPCDAEGCLSGEVYCDTSEIYPNGRKPCSKCNGSGSLSLQSIFKIYKRKIFPNQPELNTNIPPVEFITPDVNILEYNSRSYKDSIKMAEEAVYVQQRIETGNVESAKSKEYQLSEMYNWVKRIADRFYDNVESTINILQQLNGVFDKVSCERPISMAIINELEAFDLLQSIVSSDSPQFLKNSQLETFLAKYISKGSNIQRIVKLLKKIDLFALYSTKDIDVLTNTNDITDYDRFTHRYALPVIMQLLSFDSDFLLNEDEMIIKKVNEVIDSKRPKELKNSIINSI